MKIVNFSLQSPESPKIRQFKRFFHGESIKDCVTSPKFATSFQIKQDNKNRLHQATDPLIFDSRVENRGDF